MKNSLDIKFGSLISNVLERWIVFLSLFAAVFYFCFAYLDTYSPQNSHTTSIVMDDFRSSSLNKCSDHNSDYGLTFNCSDRYTINNSNLTKPLKERASSQWFLDQLSREVAPFPIVNVFLKVHDLTDNRKFRISLVILTDDEKIAETITSKTNELLKKTYFMVLRGAVAKSFRVFISDICKAELLKEARSNPIKIDLFPGFSLGDALSSHIEKQNTDILLEMCPERIKNSGINNVMKSTIKNLGTDVGFKVSEVVNTTKTLPDALKYFVALLVACLFVFLSSCLVSVTREFLK